MSYTSHTPTNRVGPGMVRRTYYLPQEIVTALDRAVVAAQSAAYGDRAPAKSDVVAAVIRAGLDAMPAVVTHLRDGREDRAGATRVGGWVRPVALPRSIDDLQGPLSDEISLPIGVYSSGAGGDQRFDLSRESTRRTAYETLLAEGTEADLAKYVNAAALKDMWAHLFLPRYVREAWELRFPELTR